MSNTVGYSIGCVTPVRYNLTQGEDATGNVVAFSLPSCAAPPIGDESVTLSTVSQSSTPTLIGFSEYADPSSPPKKYLKQVASGEFSRCFWTDECFGTNQTSSDRFVYYGYDLYNPLTGVAAYGTKQDIYQNINQQVCPATRVLGTFGPLSSVAFDAALDGSSTRFSDKTTTTREGVGCGYGYVHPVGNRWWNTDGSNTRSLELEDTETDAIARATSTLGTDSMAIRTARTTGFSFDFTTVEATLSCSNLDSSLRYRVRYDIKRTNLATSETTLTPYEVDIPENLASYDLDPITLVPDSGFSLELVNYSISTR